MSRIGKFRDRKWISGYLGLGDGSGGKVTVITKRCLFSFVLMKMF